MRPWIPAGDWLRISTPHPRRVWNDPDCYPTHVVSWCTSIITIEGGTAISRLASTQFSGLATPHPVGKLRGVIWLGVTGQQCFAWQTACCLRIPYGSCSPSPACELQLEVNSAPVILTSAITPRVASVALLISCWGGGRFAALLPWAPSTTCCTSQRHQFLGHPMAATFTSSL